MFMLLLFFIIPASLQSTNSIEDHWPFKIDYILIEMYGVFLDSSSSAPNVDPGIHQITFVDPLSYVPDQILLLCTKFYVVSPSNSYIRYSYESQNISSTGFILKTEFNKNLHYSIVIGYLTIIKGYGLEIVHIDNLSFTMSTETSVKVYKAIAASGLFLNASNSSDYFLAPFTSTLHITNFSNKNVYQTSTSLQLGGVEVTAKVPSNSTIQYLSIKLLVYVRSIFNSATSQFFGYIFECQYYTNVTSTPTDIHKNTNISSTLYILGSPLSGPFANTFGFGLYLEDKPIPPIPGLYNITYIRNRNDSRNTFHTYFNGMTVPSLFASITMYRVACDQIHPYLLMRQQKCYQKCPKYYYHDANNRCNYCYECDNIADCDDCYYSMCADDEYYDPNHKICLKCSTIDFLCEKCFKGKCTSCNSSSKTQVNNGLCKCSNNEFLETSTNRCQSCFGSSNCWQCINRTHCQKCKYPYKLRVDNTCNECEYPYRMNQQNKCQQCFQQYMYTDDKTCQLPVYAPLLASRTITVFAQFSYDLKIVQKKTKSQWYIDGSICNAVITYIYQNNTIKAEIYMNSSIRSPTIMVQFIITEDEFQMKKTKESSTIEDFYFITQEEKTVFDRISDVVNRMSENSGLIFSSASLTSTSPYIIAIFWNIQIASFYIFLPVYKPRNLNLLLNATQKLLNIDLLPFNSPNPFDNVDTVVQGPQIYNYYDVDLYFLRSNIEDILCLLYFIIFYLLCFLLFSRIRTQWYLVKLIKFKFVNQVYMNISMNFYSIITSMSFSASASLTSRKFQHKQLILNNGSASFALLVIFFFCIIHPIILFVYKKQLNWDTDDCYIGLNQNKNNSQLMLSFVLIFQITIPVIIPLFHPLFSLTYVTSLSVIYIFLLVKTKILKFKICTYCKILGQISYMLFNLLFIAYYLIQHYLPDFNIRALEIMGYVSIGSITFVVLLEVVQILNEIIHDIIKFSRKIYKIYKRKSQKTSQRNSSVCINLNMQIKQRKLQAAQKMMEARSLTQQNFICPFIIDSQILEPNNLYSQNIQNVSKLGLQKQESGKEINVQKKIDIQNIQPAGVGIKSMINLRRIPLRANNLQEYKLSSFKTNNNLQIINSSQIADCKDSKINIQELI